MATIEDLLLMRLQEENANKPSSAEALLTGSALGGIAGAAAGTIPNSIGRGVNAMTGRKPNRIKPGFRMAGGFVGAALGGALGAGVRQQMIDNSPTAYMLAKAQTQGGLNEVDTYLLRDMIADTYKQMGLT